MYESTSIPVNHGSLDAMFESSNNDKAVIITHPHPQYGGDMYNSVVHWLANVFGKKGYSTLRFNFRGVGESTGQYNNGIGEQDDLKAAIDYLAEKKYTSIALAGYSFGTWIMHNLVIRDKLKNDLFYISPPVDFIEFRKEIKLPNLRSVIVGDRDDFASIKNLEDYVDNWKSDIKINVISGADHFYTGYLEKIESALNSRQ